MFLTFNFKDATRSICCPGDLLQKYPDLSCISSSITLPLYLWMGNIDSLDHVVELLQILLRVILLQLLPWTVNVETVQLTNKGRAVTVTVTS